MKTVFKFVNLSSLQGSTLVALLPSRVLCREGGGAKAVPRYLVSLSWAPNAIPSYGPDLFTLCMYISQHKNMTFTLGE